MKNKLLNTSILVMFFTIGSKIIAMLRDALMASTYGVEIENATFIFAMRTTMLLVSVGYGLTMALIPIHSKILSEGDELKKREFANKTLTITVICSIVLSIVGIMFASPIVKILSKDIAQNPEAFPQAVLLLRIMFVSIVFVGPQSVLAAILQCHERFLIPASMALWSNLVYLVYQLIFLKYFGIVGYGVAVVIGFFVMMAVNLPTYYKLNYRFKWILDVDDKNIRLLGKSLLPIVISSSLVQINLSILTNIAGSITSSSIVILDYSNKMTTMFYEVFAIAINMVTYPILAALKANNRMEEYNDSLIKSINYILLILLPVSVGLFLLRVPVMAAYLMRGEFTLELVVRTAEFLALLIPTIILLALKDIFSRCFFSLGNQKIVLKNSVITIIILFITTFLLKYVLGESALAVGYSLTSLITMIMLYIPLKKIIGLNFKGENIKNILKMVIATIFMGIPVYLIGRVFWTNNVITDKSSILLMVISGGIGIIIYGVGLILLKVDEVRNLKEFIQSKLGLKNV